MLEKLLADALVEADGALPFDPASIERIAVQWVTETWRASGDTRWAVVTLAQLGETHLHFNLRLYIGLDDEWLGQWGRAPNDLMREAETALDALLQRGPTAP
jgi:hypothetical protein